jgi:hypothetical protein
MIVMKEMMRKVKFFITFDFPIQSDFISAQFASTHTNYQKQYQHWSLSASRRKVIADFWFHHVLLHYTFIVTTAIIIYVFTGSNSDQGLNTWLPV